MKTQHKLAISLVTLALVAMFAMPAQAALSIRLIDTAGTTNCVGVNVCIASDATFTLDITTAISNSPGGPATLQKSVNLTIAPGATFPADLTVIVTDDGFLLPSGFATLSETVNTNSPIGPTSATGTVTGQGYLSNTNTLFDTTGPTTGPAFVNTFLVGGAATSSTNTNFVTPFAMTEVLNIHALTGGFATFTATLAATSVPEPGSVALLGGALLFITGAIRRKAKQN